ncbi:hypothetical protein FB567DRAFT_599414 [Paraphoma chrysanthemicola]|uniref:Uncharacterized protein n=1 Tax=Paraphoma chrysanthemicola TaxID=798071 RepID=A0A8K0QRN6_9PLEO|nr:hypothetical protein FB567DRAFT_599414 [Paraphoma chrysanthemicola]
MSFMSNDVASARMFGTQSIRSDAGHLFTPNSDEGFPRMIDEDSFLAASVEPRTPAVGASLARRPSAPSVPGRGVVRASDVLQLGRQATVLTNAGPGFFTTPHTAQDPFFFTANPISVEFSAEFANWLIDYTTEEEDIDDEVPTTPEIFAATCQAIETAAPGHYAWNDFGRQKSDILFENQNPWDFLSDCATEAMKKSLLLRSVLGPIEHLPLPASLPDGNLPPPSFSPEHMAEFGPALAETAYKVHLEFSFRESCQAGMIMRGLYRDLTSANVNVPEYLDYWEDQPNVIPGVSASFLAGLGVFRILADSSGKSEIGIYERVACSIQKSAATTCSIRRVTATS